MIKALQWVLSKVAGTKMIKEKDFNECGMLCCP